MDQDPGGELPPHLLFLDRGKHAPNEERGCVMEAASWLAGERWSDHPKSVHPVIARVARRTNDTLDDDERQRLWGLVLASVGTARPRRLGLHCRLAWAARHQESYATGEAWRELLALHSRLTHAPTPDLEISAVNGKEPSSSLPKVP